MPSVASKIFTKPFLITLFRYALTAVGAWLFSRYGFSEASWETISGALLVIANALMGGADSVKDKVVQDGKSIETAALPAAARKEIEKAVETKKTRTVMDILFGK